MADEELKAPVPIVHKSGLHLSARFNGRKTPDDSSLLRSETSADHVNLRALGLTVHRNTVPPWQLVYAFSIFILLGLVLLVQQRISQNTNPLPTRQMASVKEEAKPSSPPASSDARNEDGQKGTDVDH